MTAKTQEWFDDESFWDTYAPIMFESERWAEVPSVVDGIELLAPGDRARKVLDLCCGMGRVSVELARRGYEVTGVDLTASYLDAARELSEAEEVSIEFLRADAREFVRPSAFPLALNLYTSFGYFGDRADDELVVRRVRESLSPGGVFILEMMGKETAVRDFTPGEEFERGGFHVTTAFSPVNDWEGLRSSWTLRRDGQEFLHVHVQRLYSATEMKTLFLRCGFSSASVYGDWDGSPYDEKARELIAVGRV